jgi:hypothetical protein
MNVSTAEEKRDERWGIENFLYRSPSPDPLTSQSFYLQRYGLARSIPLNQVVRK